MPNDQNGSALCNPVQSASLGDVVENPKDLEAGLNPTRDAIEDAESPYVNLIVVRMEDQDAPWVETLVESYQTPEVFIEETFQGLSFLGGKNTAKYPLSSPFTKNPPLKQFLTPWPKR